ncbi:hypothetical protein QEG98_28145 [Myxococcus sp. MxC21-1]|uniref:hypothetical protein n=1 Tax=Myxococcus sp. MxC21-1 TaxID=3041439 RepID=UPI0029303379|nr:hypothetical protein [Myxococcus sp. MxC21-1]WNZ59877.1 hypothetical protein QEG98_28145 [Myxococcus sp. MxC21-1]
MTANIERYRQLRADILADTQLLEILKAVPMTLATLTQKSPAARVEDRLAKNKRDIAQCLKDLEDAGF